jgi:hypothetical protein
MLGEVMENQGQTSNGTNVTTFADEWATLW